MGFDRNSRRASWQYQYILGAGDRGSSKRHCDAILATSFFSVVGIGRIDVREVAVWIEREILIQQSLDHLRKCDGHTSNDWRVPGNGPDRRHAQYELQACVCNRLTGCILGNWRYPNGSVRRNEPLRDTDLD